MADESSSVVSSTPAIPSSITGRWLWFGLQQFTRAQWEQVCAQAVTWQLQGVHPKVADGVNRWYDADGLQMLKEVANRHGLDIIPYHYCYGPQFGAAQITAEAQLSAEIGAVFAAVIPDIEDSYMGQYESATSFGQQVRAQFKGLWLPTLYANPLTHPVPLLSLNPFMDAWLPQVYFALWNGIAQDAISYVYPQWLHFDQLAQQQGQGGLKPILPIMSLEQNVATQQVTNFLTLMRNYGYIGFWHYGCYAPYANTIVHAPQPTLSAPAAPPVSPPSANAPKPQPTLPAALAFTDDDRQVWTLYKPISLNEQMPIAQSWLIARRQRGWNFGPPLEEAHPVVREAKNYLEQQFCSARASIEVASGHLTWWTANGPVHL
jgi:hypothetical protein